MEERLKERLVGATVLVLLAVVFVPMLLDVPWKEGEGTPDAIPERPRGGFTTKTISLGEPETPRLDAEIEREHRRHAQEATDAPRDSTGTSATASATTTRNETSLAAAPQEPAVAPQESAAASQEPAAARESAAEAAGTAPGGWAVQLGSFSVPKNALALRDRLRSKGYAAFIESGFTAEGEVSRVFVGPVLERGRAESSMAKLRREMQIEGIVVRYPGG